MVAAPVAVAKGERVPFLLAGQGGTAAEVVKVLELPDVPLLQRANGSYVDLGYKWDAEGRGSWVGFIGSSNHFVALDADTLEMVKMIAGLKAMPLEPKRPLPINYWYILLFFSAVLATSKTIASLKIVLAEARANPDEAGAYPPKPASSFETAQAAAATAAAVLAKPKRVRVSQMPSGAFASRERQHVNAHVRFGRR